ncbi:MAG: S8 family serine peptidase [Alphaproteobacteria bacterium]|nr:S8 family serine peptidase [Alphaproteobacteria bacterium]MBP7729744.1 S8 family serine peptidase [Alphaproteobacteria bacterium]
MMFRSLMMGISLVSLLAAGEAMAMEDDSFPDSNHTKQIQVSLHTVMNPQGVTQEEWQAMFEGVRGSMKEQAKGANEFIELFNNSFKKLRPKESEEWMADYKESYKEDLSLPYPLLHISTLNSRETIENIMKTLVWVKDTRPFLCPRIGGLYFRSTKPICTLFANCKILLESFKSPLTSLQFSHADKVHKRDIKGKGAKVLVIETDVVSDHSFLKNNNQVKVGESFSKDHREWVTGHGAHVTGIVHQLAPETEIFVSQNIESDKSLMSTTTAKIINASYGFRLPRFHLLFEKERATLKKVLNEYKTYTSDPLHISLMWLIKREMGDSDKFEDCLRYILRQYEKDSQSNEDDAVETMMKNASQQSYLDAKERLQENIQLFQGKLHIKSFGNGYNDKNWRYEALPSLVTEDAFLKDSILVMNITRENKLASSSNRPDQTLKEIIQTIMKEGGIEGPKAIDHHLRKVQESSLSALGTNVWSTGSQDQYEWYSGTSMAAPMVTGVAALIEGEHPDFSIGEIRECLLNSANREFVIGSGKNAVHVVDLPQEEVNLLNEMDVGSQKYIAFDPSQYGKGILDADAALKYAEFKSANRSAPVDELIRMLKEWRGERSQ